MAKMVEQLDIKDLKGCFRDALREIIGQRPADVERAEWTIFWNKVKRRCTTVERI